ncbi:MAG: phosphoribosyl-ATP diphosphatase [SAR324 cluster bacterium]|nr:phosphoribosyl-ATP diphosphatase [SAR324 cluster bacterium]
MNIGICGAMFDQIYKVIRERKQSSPEKSYVASLITEGTDSILKKIGEESAEVIIATKNKNSEKQIHEITDLWFHMLILMVDQEITLEEISKEFKKRFGQSGLEEKARRIN